MVMASLLLSLRCRVERRVKRCLLSKVVYRYDHDANYGSPINRQEHRFG